MVGAIGFEPTTPCAQGRCATRLRYAPTGSAELILKQFQTLLPPRTMIFIHKRAKTVPISCSLHGDRARMRTCFFSRRAWSFGRHFIGAAVELLQGLALHLQLHLRVFLEDLRVSLAKHLCDPLVGYAFHSRFTRISSWTRSFWNASSPGGSGMDSSGPTSRLRRRAQLRIPTSSCVICLRAGVEVTTIA